MTSNTATAYEAAMRAGDLIATFVSFVARLSLPHARVVVLDCPDEATTEADDVASAARKHARLTAELARGALPEEP